MSENTVQNLRVPLNATDHYVMKYKKNAILKKMYPEIATLIDVTYEWTEFHKPSDFICGNLNPIVNYLCSILSRIIEALDKGSITEVINNGDDYVFIHTTLDFNAINILKPVLNPIMKTLLDEYLKGNIITKSMKFKYACRNSFLSFAIIPFDDDKTDIYEHNGIYYSDNGRDQC